MDDVLMVDVPVSAASFDEARDKVLARFIGRTITVEAAERDQRATWHTRGVIEPMRRGKDGLWHFTVRMGLLG